MKPRQPLLPWMASEYDFLLYCVYSFLADKYPVLLVMEPFYSAGQEASQSAGEA